MSQKELGSILGIKEKAVEEIESGREANIRADEIKLLCETFRELPGALLYGRDYNYWEQLSEPDARTGKDALGDREMIFMVEGAMEGMLGAMGLTLMQDVRLLNDMGMRRAKALIEDLLKIEEYQKGDRETLL